MTLHAEKIHLLLPTTPFLIFIPSKCREDAHVCLLDHIVDLYVLHNKAFTEFYDTCAAKQDMKYINI